MDIEQIINLLSKEVNTFQAPIKDFEKIQTKEPFKVLVATILSSRTKDEVTSQAAKRLFDRVKNPEDLEQLSVSEIEKLIYPVGFYRVKARNLARLPSALKEVGGKVPDTMEELLKLPGVGRKTANLVLSRAFGKPAICVDTHVHRLVNMWGFVHSKTPEQTEDALKKLLPLHLWSQVNPTLVAFGQKVCKPKSPRCTCCPLSSWCSSSTIDDPNSSF